MAMRRMLYAGLTRGWDAWLDLRISRHEAVSLLVSRMVSWSAGLSAGLNPLTSRSATLASCARNPNLASATMSHPHQAVPAGSPHTQSSTGLPPTQLAPPLPSTACGAPSHWQQDAGPWRRCCLRAVDAGVAVKAVLPTPRLIGATARSRSKPNAIEQSLASLKSLNAPPGPKAASVPTRQRSVLVLLLTASGPL